MNFESGQELKVSLEDGRQPFTAWFDRLVSIPELPKDVKNPKASMLVWTYQGDAHYVSADQIKVT